MPAGLSSLRRPVASRKEEKERLRREREERERAAAAEARRKRLVGYGIGGALALAAVVVLIVLLVGGGGGGEDDGGQKASIYPSGGTVAKAGETDVGKAAKAAGCVTKQERAKSRDHVGNPNQVIKYDSNPPMTGRHYEIPAEDQAFTQPPPDSSVIHSLEHGRIDIWFQPKAPSKLRADLKATYDSEQGYQLLLIPRPKMPYQMAATAWGRDPQPLGTGYMLACKTGGAEALTALRAFIDEHRGNGPEPVP
jgi:Protein of unknown function (DUF3105)